MNKNFIQKKTKIFFYKFTYLHIYIFTYLHIYLFTVPWPATHMPGINAGQYNWYGAGMWPW